MEFKQFLIERLMLFFTLTTLITVAIFILGSSFDPEATFGYDAFLSPILFAGACVCPTLVTYSKHELNVRQLLLRKTIELFLIEAVVLSIAFYVPTIDTGRPVVVGTLFISVFIIYIVTDLLDWLKDSMEAKKMSEDLIRFQNIQN